MTLKEAITIARKKMFIDYTGKTERQIKEIWEAMDTVLTAAIKYSELDEQEPMETRNEYARGFKAGTKVGARAERTMMIAYLEGKTIEERKEEIVAIPYVGETREEEPDS